MNNLNDIISLYIHIPFCNSICTYCDFYKMISKDSIKNKYVSYLCKEMKLKCNYLNNIKTIYIGGGTPSSLSLNNLEILFKTIHEYIDFSKVIEFSIEANPSDINEELVKLLINYKVNRISLGVQSIRDRKLKILGRLHSYDTVKNAINILNKFGLRNINIDYMYGIDDSIDSVREELSEIVKLDIKHISCYSLILEEHTILYNKFLKKEFKPIDEDLEKSIYYEIIKVLSNNGYVHYEISNFSKPNYQSMHNLTYWHNLHYLGIGAGSSYYIDNIRYTNIMNLNSYFEGIDNNCLNYSEYNILTENDIIEEEIMLGLRTLKGISIELFEKKFRKSIFSCFPVINSLIQKDLLQNINGYLSIPENKLYVSNEIILNFIK